MSLWWDSLVWRRRARRVGEEKQIDWQEFEWDEININHIAEHQVEPWEAEEAILERDRAPRAAYGGATGIIGMTLDGRLLVVIFLRKANRRMRVISARDAGRRERRIYRRHNR